MSRKVKTNLDFHLDEKTIEDFKIDRLNHKYTDLDGKEKFYFGIELIDYIHWLEMYYLTYKKRVAPLEL